MIDLNNRRIKSTIEIAILRFWIKVNKKGEDECWNWLGHKLPSGHGVFGIYKKRTYAHRFSWELHFGKIPKGLYVCHKCDNGSCVNPKHLFIGTQKENMQDMSKKGRGIHPEEKRARGSKNGNSKLTEKEVKEIREKYIPFKITHKKLAQEYNVSEPTIKNILNRKVWANI